MTIDGELQREQTNAARAGWIVPGLLPTCLSTPAGRPKMGKSRLTLQIACAAGAGGSVPDRTAERGPVLLVGPVLPPYTQ